MFDFKRVASLVLLLIGLYSWPTNTHPTSSLPLTKRSILLYQNNGDWSAHAETPSAILFPDPVTFSEAEETCRSEGEALVNEGDLKSFKLPLQYLAYLGNISPAEQYWTASSKLHGSKGQKRVFVCTNSAPLVQSVNTTFSAFPKTYVLSNGTTYMGVRDHMTYRFLGIPFMLQPVGDLRLAYPIQWYTNETNYVLNATTYGPTCPTKGGYFYGDTYGLNPYGNSEACLLMNIFTPYIPSSDPSEENLKPVMFWLHGGGGTATDATFDGASLTSRSDVVLVSINWRQGTFAMSLDDGYVDGNYGIADIVSGLQWVHDHIQEFGGNPNNVTVFGQSAGGESVMNMVRSPKAAGLFTAAILQSAAVGPSVTQEEVANVTVPAVAKVCGNDTDAERLACLRALPLAEFMNISFSIGESFDNVDGQAIVDGIWIANSTAAAARNHQVNDIYYMAGSMPEEGQSLLGTMIAPNATDFNATLYSLAGSQYPDDWPAVVESSGVWTNGSNPINAYNMTINAFTTIHLTCPGEQYVQIANEAKAFKAIYYYQMLRAYALSFYDQYDLCTFPVGEPETPYYRCHSGDLYEVFGSYFIFDQPVRVPEDIGYTNLVQDMWASFARTGNPNPSLDYLRARGYSDSLTIFEKFSWPEYNGQNAINIDYPNPTISGLPWSAQCDVVAGQFIIP